MGAVRIARRGLRGLSEKEEFPTGSVHYLHVGKAAGTQIKHVIEQVNQPRLAGKLVAHNHEIGLADLPHDDDYFFSTQDPATRFKSGFYSRLRKGQPRIYVEWSEHERLAFEQFPHANDLAESLFLTGQKGQNATAAIRSIRLCSRNLVDWFKFCGNLFEVRPPIWIIRQENFSADLDIFLKRIGHDGPLDLVTGETASHANDYDDIPNLSDTAKTNLHRWYAQDYEFLEMCEAWMDENIDNASLSSPIQS